MGGCGAVGVGGGGGFGLCEGFALLFVVLLFEGGVALPQCLHLLSSLVILPLQIFHIVLDRPRLINQLLRYLRLSERP